MLEIAGCPWLVRGGYRVWFTPIADGVRGDRCHRPAPMEKKFDVPLEVFSPELRGCAAWFLLRERPENRTAASLYIRLRRF